MGALVVTRIGAGKAIDEDAHILVRRGGSYGP
ncbi:MAG: hypothetical protein ACJA1W_004421 [Akkermansiaceae bacterium]|jgi:hypothetical protein